MGITWDLLTIGSYLNLYDLGLPTFSMGFHTSCFPDMKRFFVTHVLLDLIEKSEFILYTGSSILQRNCVLGLESSTRISVIGLEKK